MEFCIIHLKGSFESGIPPGLICLQIQFDLCPALLNPLGIEDRQDSFLLKFSAKRKHKGAIRIEGRRQTRREGQEELSFQVPVIGRREGEGALNPRFSPGQVCFRPI